MRRNAPSRGREHERILWEGEVALLSIIVQCGTGAELLRAVFTGRTTRVAFAVVTSVAALWLPDVLDPAAAIVEMAILRRMP